jgi:hypothetical protein
MVCRLVVDQSPWAHHGLDRFVSLLDLAPQTLATHGLVQRRREIWLS